MWRETRTLTKVRPSPLKHKESITKDNDRENVASTNESYDTKEEVEEEKVKQKPTEAPHTRMRQVAIYHC